VVWSILGIWAALGVWQLVRFVFGLVALERLKRNATPLPIAYRQGLSRWNAAEAVRSNVRLCVSDEISVPIAVGLFDAMILVPQALLDQLPQDDVDRILLHELTHLRRGDDWIHAFQRLVTGLCFFSPAVAFIARQMDLEREVSCDDSVLEHDGLQPVPYATCLTKMAEIVAWPYQPLAAPGVFDTRRSLSIRVERLLNSARDNRTRIAAAPALSALFVMSAAGIAGAAASSNFSFALPAICQQVQTHAITHFVRLHVQGAAQHLAAPRLVQRVVFVPLAPVAAMASATKPVVATKPAAATKPAVATKPAIATKPAVATKRTIVATSTANAKATVKAKAAMPRVEVAAASPDPDGDYIAELANAGYRGLSINELIQLKAVGVDADYIRAMQAAGFAHPSTRELIELRTSGVTPAVVDELRRRFGQVSTRELVELHNVGVTGDYIDALEKAGYRDLQAREVVELRAVGVTPDVISELRSRLPSLRLEQVAQLHAVGVDPAYIDSLSRAGYSGLSAGQLLQLRSLGVDAEYIQKVQAHGFHNVTVQQLIEMKATGLL
jgi:beta-lactamase regulating signal transducer with metallopeptidase domain